MTAPGQPLTIVMYHYVRPITGSAHPGIKGLELEAFRGQVEYVLRHHTVVSMDDAVAAARGECVAPECPAVLTFDDGYADHARHVFPVLREHGVSGAFFPPSEAVLERRPLDVNKVQFVLASGVDPAILVATIEDAVVTADRADVGPLEAYRRELHVANRFDPAPVIYVKRMLQHALPEDLRTAIVDDLFRRYVTTDETGFADDLYLRVEDLRTMVDGGMHVGTHGHAHRWLDRLERGAQAADIDRSLALLDAVGLPRRGFTFCYPYGGFTDETKEVLEERGCAAAVTTRVGLATLSPADLLELPRLDTNDLPTDAAAAPSSWTVAAGTPTTGPTPTP